MTPVVTAQEIEDWTEVADVPESKIKKALGVIDIHAGLDRPLTQLEDLDHLSDHDKNFVRMAVAWQAAWLVDQIDYAARTDVQGTSGTGGSDGFTTRDPHSLFLSPLASRALSRCSWRVPRSSRDATRARERRALLVPPDVHVSTSPIDNPNQLLNALTDAGPWAEVD